MPLRVFGTVVVFLILGGCASFGFDPDLSKPRDYILPVEVDGFGPIMHIACTYIGKQPDGVFKHDFDWQSKGTDFYHFTFHNLTSSPIIFQTLRSYSKYPSTYTLHLQKNVDDAIIREGPDTIFRNLQKAPLSNKSILGPKEVLNLKNAFYYGGVPFNIRYQEFSFQWREKKFQFTVYLIFTR